MGRRGVAFDGLSLFRYRKLSISRLEWSSSAGLTVAESELRDLLRGGGASPPSSDSPLEARLVRVPPRFSHNYYRLGIRFGGVHRTQATFVCVLKMFTNPFSPRIYLALLIYEEISVSSPRFHTEPTFKKKNTKKQDSCTSAKTDTNNDCHQLILV